jgi:Uncharacterized protein conserved in bacteria (DUF2252)
MTRPPTRTGARWRTLIGAAVCAAWLAMSAAQTPATDVPLGDPASFRVDKATLRAKGASAALIDRVTARALRYFRLLARASSSRTCNEFADLRWRLPAVAVHGDAHLEQFVVTGENFGLADFDMSGFGPAVVDLVRYAASLHVACREMAWACDGDAATAAYFAAYHEAVDHPVERTRPAVVERLRQSVPQEQETWLRWADTLMKPLPADREASLRDGWGRFIDLMLETRPERPQGFYRLERVGSIEMGIGSALEPKTLVRIAGPTKAPNDDLILEIRITSSDVDPCVARPPNGGSLHVSLLGTLLGAGLPDVFGFMPQQGDRTAPELWVQSWDRGYRDLSAADVQSQAELNELAADAGRQLAGHFWTTFPEPLRGHLRFAQLRAFELSQVRARAAARRYADETIRGWEAFKQQP